MDHGVARCDMLNLLYTSLLFFPFERLVLVSPLGVPPPAHTARRDEEQHPYTRQGQDEPSPSEHQHLIHDIGREKTHLENQCGSYGTNTLSSMMTPPPSVMPPLHNSSPLSSTFSFFPGLSFFVVSIPLTCCLYDLRHLTEARPLAPILADVSPLLSELLAFRTPTKNELSPVARNTTSPNFDFDASSVEYTTSSSMLRGRPSEGGATALDVPDIGIRGWVGIMCSWSNLSSSSR